MFHIYILCFHNKIYTLKLLLIYLFDKKNQNDNEGNQKNLHDYVLTTTIGAEEIEESTSVETFWKTTVYMCIMDTVINNLKY